jgi:hypothetical protein
MRNENQDVEQHSVQTTDPRRVTAPAADAPTVSPEPEACDLPVAPWHPGWTWRHILVAAAASLAGWVFYRDLAVSASGLGWAAVLGLLSVAAGLVAASYLPRSGERWHAPRDLCAYSPMLMLLAAGFFLTIAEGSLWAASPSLVLAAAAVLRRTTGSSTCSV